ncbi:DNA polymerase III subunit delta [Anaerofustis sp.]|uniref:DNA polymerase III subunit delta n=1 Tax=Anaerofustis sp. TaxID=1872517 RepID=UPI0025C70CD1|nr:DNA polymerase III subunit delta [Anaerofustis sp.]
MDYIKLNENIKKKNFKNIYLFNVGENYIAKMMFDSLKNNLIKKEYEDFNYSLFDGKKIDINKVTELCETLPMMDEHRLVLLKGDYLRNKEFGKKLSDYIKNIPSDTVMVVWVEGSMDKRTALYKSIKKNGDIVDFEKFKEYKLEGWIRKKIKDSGMILSKEAVSYFIEASGYLLENSDVDLGYFVSEIEKLSSMEQKEIGINDIKKIISVNIKDEIFKLTDALRDKNSDYAFRLLSNLEYNNVNFMQILAVIIRNFENMYICKVYLKNGKSEKDIVNDYSLHPYAVKMANVGAGKYSFKDICDSLYLCLDLDYKIKVGQISSKDAGVVLIEKISNR